MVCTLGSRIARIVFGVEYCQFVRLEGHFAREILSLQTLTPLQILAQACLLLPVRTRVSLKFHQTNKAHKRQ